MDIEKEIKGLKKVNKIFSEKCFIKLIEKLTQKFEGWDNKEYKKIYQCRLLALSKKQLTQNNLINIANYCSFLWFMEEKAQNKIKKSINNI